MQKEVTGPVMRCPLGYKLELNPIEPNALQERAKKLYSYSGSSLKRKRLEKKVSESNENDFEGNWAYSIDSSMVYEDIISNAEEVDDFERRRRTFEGAYAGETPNGNRTLDEVDGTFVRPAEYRCVGVERKLYSTGQWAELGGACLPGYTLVNTFKTESNFYEEEEYHICEASPVLPAEPFCPKGWKPALVIYNSANFLQEKAIACGSATRYKGRIWCPDTFVISGEPAPGLPFGAEVKDTSSGETDYDPYVYDTVSLTRDTPAKCQRWVSVESDQCTEKQCKDPVMKEVSKLVRHFAYYALKRDPDYFHYIAMQGGKDRRWTPKAEQFPQ